MSESSQPEKKLKLISLEPKIVIVAQNKSDIQSPQSDDKPVIIAPYLFPLKYIDYTIRQIIF